MADLLLVGLNARCINPAAGARSLLANLGALSKRAALLERVAADDLPHALTG